MKDTNKEKVDYKKLYYAKAEECKVYNDLCEQLDSRVNMLEERELGYRFWCWKGNLLYKFNRLLDRIIKSRTN